MKTIKKIIALFLVMVASIAFNANAVEAPNAPLPLADFVKLVSNHMRTNIVISPGLVDEQVHVYGADKYSVENLFNAVLSSNGLTVERRDGVHVLKRKTAKHANYEMRPFNLEQSKPELVEQLTRQFEYLNTTYGYPCYFSKETDYLVFANCPRDVFPVVNNYFLYVTKPVKKILIKAHVLETTDTDFYSVGVKYGLNTKNGGMSYSINESALSSAIKSVGLDFSFDNFSTFVNLLETDASVKTVSKPHLLVDSNSDAFFEAVQNIPVVTLLDEGGDGDRARTQIQYQKVGVMLKVRAVYLSTGRVKLYMSSEYSDVESLSQSNQNPVFNTKSISTEVTITPGEMVTIGGLISHDEDEHLGGVPLLKDIPYIGGAFSNTYTNNVKRELSIMLTVDVE